MNSQCFNFDSFQRTMSKTIKHESDIKVHGEILLIFHDCDENKSQIFKMDGQKVKEFESMRHLSHLSVNKFAFVDREELRISGADFTILNELKLEGYIP